ncbi:MAG: ORC1-type DNA replication protein [Candidatus Bathyarchaeia archaeon]
MSYTYSVFKDETKLDISYVPARLIHRERELRLLEEFFNFIFKTPGKMTQRVIIAGAVGTGKTALAQRFGIDIMKKAEEHNLRFRYIHVNCREYRGSLFLILHHVVSAFHPNFPRRGFSSEEMLRILMQILDEQDVHVILTLDEFESLVERDGSEAVYKLTRLQETRLGMPQRISMIFIVRSLKPLESLDPSSRSTLQSNIICLDAYTQEQLVDILNDRVKLAFKPFTVMEETVNLIAELASSEGGNARLAIELLWRAGKYADAEGFNIVTPECARKAASSIYVLAKKSDLAYLGLHEKLFLLGVARLFKESDRAYATLSELERAYMIVCEEYGETPHSHTQLWKYLQNLAAQGILKAKVSSQGQRGRKTLISLLGIPAEELDKTITQLLGRK